MEATLIDSSLKVEQTGNTTYVPDNDIAKLMYYLDCVMAVIQYDKESKYTDYEHYYNLNSDEEEAVCALAILLNPKIFIDAKIFLLNPNLVPYGSSNQFYKITDQTVGVHVNSEIVVAGKVVKVLKMMALTESWLNRNYFDPIENINRRFQERKKSYSVSYLPSNNYNNNKCCSNCSCKKVCCWIIIIYIIVEIIAWYYK